MKRSLHGQRIVLCFPVEPRHVAQIEQAAPGAEVVDAGQPRLAEEILRADILCGHVKVPVPWDVVVRQGRLRWIQSSAAGMEHCLVPEVVACSDQRLVVTSASGVLADQVAEHTVALATALTRSLPTFFAAQQRREFVRRPTRDLTGSTVGLIGYGGVGRRIAEVLAAFKTRILAVDLFPVTPPPHVAAIVPPSRQHEVLAEADLLILAAPLTDLTRGMICRETLAQMKPGGLLINVARGPLVVAEDLVAALSEGRLAGAALDVTPEEPLPADSPLWNAPGLVITPHVGGQSARRADDMVEFFCENLHRWQTGQPLRNVVDKHLGFPVPAEYRTAAAS